MRSKRTEKMTDTEQAQRVLRDWDSAIRNCVVDIRETQVRLDALIDGGVAAWRKLHSDDYENIIFWGRDDPDFYTEPFTAIGVGNEDEERY